MLSYILWKASVPYSNVDTIEYGTYIAHSDVESVESKVLRISGIEWHPESAEAPSLSPNFVPANLSFLGIPLYPTYSRDSVESREYVG